MAASTSSGMILPQVFESLQQKIDQDVQIREKLREIVDSLEKQDKTTQAILSRAHSAPVSEWQNLCQAARPRLQAQVQTISLLKNEASQYPYYKYNGTWSRQMQDAVFSALLYGYLDGRSLLTIEEMGSHFDIPVNLKDRDEFHLTIEEYLHAVISLTDELSRLARNTVTLGDYERPVTIARFIKDLHAGFSVLNLKNDSLRKRSDGIKYRVKEVEDVVYDLSLRGLTPKPA